MNDWLDIREKIPAKPGKYLVMEKSGGAFGEACWDGADWNNVRMKGGQMTFFNDHGITHWKYLENDGTRT